MLNKVQPSLLFTGTLHAEKGCQLYEDMKSGAFKECAIGQLLNLLDLNDTIYFGSHPSNLVPMQAYLPKHKKEMIRYVKETRRQLKGHLDEFPVRGSEGSILNR